MIEVKHIIAAGDIHADLQQIAYYQKANKLKNTLFLQCGDFGVGRFNDGLDYKDKIIKRLKFYNDSFKAHNNFVYVCRGNHDDPAFFTGEFDQSNIKLMPDYSTLDIEYDNVIKKVLFIGGAISIDRTQRKLDISYWEDEIVKFKPEILKTISNIDIVITHTAPDFCPPIVKEGLDYWMQEDEALESDLNIERGIMTEIYHQLKTNNTMKYWCYGHFHNNTYMQFNDTKFICVDMNDFYPLRF